MEQHESQYVTSYEEEKQKKNYYDKMPEFGNKGPSKLRQHFTRGITSFLVVAACIAFYFLFLRFSIISNIFSKIFSILKPVVYGFVIAY
ncbi:MAG: AI-2E family transporter, partial [Lachnospiraceae bacterium]